MDGDEGASKAALGAGKEMMSSKGTKRVTSFPAYEPPRLRPRAKPEPPAQKEWPKSKKTQKINKMAQKGNKTAAKHSTKIGTKVVATLPKSTQDVDVDAEVSAEGAPDSHTDSNWFAVRQERLQDLKERSRDSEVLWRQNKKRKIGDVFVRREQWWLNTMLRRENVIRNQWHQDVEEVREQWKQEVEDMRGSVQEEVDTEREKWREEVDSLKEQLKELEAEIGREREISREVIRDRDAAIHDRNAVMRDRDALAAGAVPVQAKRGQKHAADGAEGDEDDGQGDGANAKLLKTTKTALTDTIVGTKMRIPPPSPAQPRAGGTRSRPKPAPPSPPMPLPHPQSPSPAGAPHAGLPHDVTELRPVPPPRNTYRAPVPQRRVAKAKATALSEQGGSFQPLPKARSQALLARAAARNPGKFARGVAKGLAGKAPKGPFRSKMAKIAKGGKEPKTAPTDSREGAAVARASRAEKRGIEFVGAPVGKQAKAWRNQKWTGDEAGNGPVTRSAARAKAAASAVGR